MRNLSVGERQGRGDPPAFYTRGHRVVAPEPIETPEQSMGRAYAFWAVVLVLAGCALAAIVIFNLPKGTT